MQEFSLKFAHFASILDLAISSRKSASSALSINKQVLDRLTLRHVSHFIGVEGIINTETDKMQRPTTVSQHHVLSCYRISSLERRLVKKGKARYLI